MDRPIRIEYAGAHYHVFTRGERKDHIFFQDEDYKKFIEKLKENLEKYNVDCVAYALMPNHYHLYLITNEANLSDFMHSLNSSYTNWIKAKRGIVGHLFQGRYKAILIDKDNYSNAVVDYIHYNPVEAGFNKLPWHYKWSSCSYYIEDNKGEDVLELKNKIILKQYSDILEIAKKLYKTNLVNKKNYNLPHRDLYKGICIGKKAFKREIEKKLKKVKENEQLRSTKMKKIRDLETIIVFLKKEFDILEEDIFNKKLKNKYKKYFVYFSKIFTRCNNQEIGDRLGLKSSSVSPILHRLKKEIERNKEMKRELENLRCKMQRSDP